VQASTYTENGRVYYKLTDVPPECAGELAGEYYTQVGEAYVRDFPADWPGMAQAAANFTRYAEQMYDPARRADPARWQEALAWFCERLAGTGLDWFLIGSVPLALRGLPVQPGGVDVVFPDSACLPRARELFTEEVVQPFAPCGDWVALGFGAAFHRLVLSMTFATAASLDEPVPSDAGPYAAAHCEEFAWRGHRLKLPPLELSLNINRRRNRPERAALIEERLRQQH
jgi:hypothetical protein